MMGSQKNFTGPFGMTLKIHLWNRWKNQIDKSYSNPSESRYKFTRYTKCQHYVQHFWCPYYVENVGTENCLSEILSDYKEFVKSKMGTLKGFEVEQ